MSGIFKGISDVLGPNRTNPIQRVNRSSAERFMIGHVLDVVLDDKSEFYASEYGIGAIRFRPMPEDYTKDEAALITFAYPVNRSQYQIPLPGEQVVIYPILHNGSVFYAYGPIVKQQQNASYSGEPYTGTMAMYLDANVLDAFVDEEASAQRFINKLQIPYDIYKTAAYSTTSLREGDMIIEGRFGSSVYFTSTLEVPIIKSLFTKKSIGEDELERDLTTGDGDPILILQTTKKAETDEPYLTKPGINTTDSAVYLTSTQIIPMRIACSRRMDTWNVNITQKKRLAAINDFESTRLQASFDDIYDPNFQFSINLQVTGFVGNGGTGFDPTTVTTGTKSDNIKLLVSRLQANGVTNRFGILGVLGTIGKECGFVPKAEYGYGSTSNARLRELFGNRLKQFDEPALETLKKNDVDFYDYIYGYLNPEYPTGWEPDNRNPGDGWKYRGRGFNQVTYKALYKKYSEKVGIDLVTDPDQLNNVSIAAEAAIIFLLSGLKGKNVKKDPNAFTNIDDAVYWCVFANHGGSREVRGSEGHLKALEIARGLDTAGIV